MSNPIRLVVGLGNPGPEYEETRHNTGFWFVDLLARRYQGQFKKESKFFGEACRITVNGRECWLLKPTTFMNRSGQSVSSLARYYKIPLEQVLVAHDELDMPAGTARLKWSGGAGGHNGLRDIVSAMDGRDFWRLRIGIDHPGDSRQVVDYVLKNPSREHAAAIHTALEAAADSFPQMLAGEQQRVMNRLHTKQEEGQ
jgi:PTH1 family peptidyl-tRNA hydrolase